MEYNFDPMTGQLLKPLILSMYSPFSQPLGALFLNPDQPGHDRPVDFARAKQGGTSIVVGSPSRSSQVVEDGRIPTMTMSSATAETTLSASSEMAPRISTSCGNMPQGDICRVIQQCPHSPINRTLVGARVGRGSARKPVQVSGSRGQKLAKMLAEIGGERGQMLAAKLGETSVGRGQSVPSPLVGRSEQRGRQADVYTEASLPPSITMHLDPQGPPVTYSEAASRSLQRMVVSSSELPVYDMQLKIAACEKEKEAA